MKPPPDRACVDKGSRFYSSECSRIGIVIDGVEQIENVIEYCVSGGWARVWRKDANGTRVPAVLGGGPAIKRVHGEIKVRWKE